MEDDEAELQDAVEEAAVKLLLLPQHLLLKSDQ